MFKQVCLVAVCVIAVVSANGMVGGFGKEKPISPQVQSLFDQAKPSIMSQLRAECSKLQESPEKPSCNKESLTITPLSYQSQVVAGVNYKILTQLSTGDGYNHKWRVTLYSRPWEHHLEVTGVTPVEEVKAN